MALGSPKKAPGWHSRAPLLVPMPVSTCSLCLSCLCRHVACACAACVNMLPVSTCCLCLCCLLPVSTCCLCLHCLSRRVDELPVVGLCVCFLSPPSGSQGHFDEATHPTITSDANSGAIWAQTKIGGWDLLSFLCCLCLPCISNLRLAAGQNTAAHK